MNTENQRVPVCAPHDETVAHCCVIGCDKPATKHIYTQPWTYDNYTHACDEHIEDLKSTVDDVVEDLQMICHKCEGDGKAHGADRPFEWTPERRYPGPCPVCKGSGVEPHLLTLDQLDGTEEMFVDDNKVKWVRSKDGRDLSLSLLTDAQYWAYMSKREQAWYK